MTPRTDLQRQFRDGGPFAVAVLLGVSGWLVLAWAGGRMSPDSTFFLDYAAQIHSTLEVPVDPIWPPLYPILIAAFLAVEPFPAEAAQLLNGLSQIVFLVAVALLLKRHRVGPVASIACLATLHLLPPFLKLSKYIWSEAPFFAVFALHLLFLDQYSRTRRLRHYVLASACVTLAVSLRYIGYALIVSLALYTLGFILHNRLRDAGHPGGRARHLLHHLLRHGAVQGLAYLPLLLILGRNLLLGGSLHGDRSVARTELDENVYRLLFQVWDDLGLLVLVLVAPILAAVLSPTLRNRPLPPVLFYLLIYLPIYIAMILIATLYTEPMNFRYCVPIYQCLVLGFFLSVAHLRKRISFLALVLLLITATPQLRSSYQIVSHVLSRQHSSILHLRAGFNLSDTQRQLRSIFDAAFVAQDRVHATVIYGETAGFLRSNVARSLFYRRGILAVPGRSNFSIERKAGSDRCVITFEDGEERKELIYHDLHPVEATPRWRQKVTDALAGGELYLIGHGDAGRDAISLLTAGPIEVASIAEAPPYRVYRLVRRHARIAR